MTERVPEAVSRRVSLLALGTAALIATVAQSAVSDVVKASKKTKRLKKKKCQKQVGQCTAFLAEACQEDPVCESAMTCCGLLANCNATDALTCIFVV